MAKSCQLDIIRQFISVDCFAFRCIPTYGFQTRSEAIVQKKVGVASPWSLKSKQILKELLCGLRMSKSLA